VPESWAAFAKAQGDVVCCRHEVLFVEEVAIQPEAAFIRFFGVQLQVVHFCQFAVAQGINFQRFAVGEDAEEAVGMLLVAQVAGQLAFAFRPFGVIQSALKLKDEVAVKGVRRNRPAP
jgi:hypothetical protein